jgi:hypothetical protein
MIDFKELHFSFYIFNGAPGSVHQEIPYSIRMICTGQRSAASCAQQQRQSGTIPSARSPLNLYSSTSCENESQGFWSKSSGQIFQHAPQLTQAPRSIETFNSVIPVVSGIPVAGQNHKGNEEGCSLAKVQSHTINISGERNFFIFCMSFPYECTPLCRNRNAMRLVWERSLMIAGRQRV